MASYFRLAMQARAKARRREGESRKPTLVRKEGICYLI